MSPIIIIGLVALWGVVLVPMWLRRHEESEELRSVDKFSSAMRTLSRREHGLGRYVVMPHRAREVEVHVSGASDLGEEYDDEPRRRLAVLGSVIRRRRELRPQRRALTAAERRLRCVLGLVTAVLVVLVLAAAVGGTLLWGVQVVLDLLLVGYVGVLRRSARTRAVAVARSRRRAAAAAARPAVRRAAPAPARAGADAPAAGPGRPEVASAFVMHPRSAPAVAEETPAVDQVTEEVVAADAAEWQPVPVPRPTYTMKPAAPARRRRRAPDVEDLVASVEPAYTSDRADDDAFDAQRVSAARKRHDVTADLTEEMAMLDDILTHRRAVND